MDSLNANRSLILSYLLLLRKVLNLSEELRLHFNEMIDIIEDTKSSDDERKMSLNTAAEILNSIK